MKHKTVGIEIVKQEDNGGEVVISTGALDRDRDRVNPLGAKVENYLKNPVVQWGHNYRDPWATIGKTTDLSITPDGIKATFELRDPVSDSDPQNVIRQLWNEGWIKTASIGFNPNFETVKENDDGGFDFDDWELLEWSLVPVPANQEALRLAVKGLAVEPDPEPDPGPEEKTNPAIIAALGGFIKAMKEEFTNE